MKLIILLLSFNSITQRDVLYKQKGMAIVYIQLLREQYGHKEVNTKLAKGRAIMKNVILHT
jgi:hypothetical protein